MINKIRGYYFLFKGLNKKTIPPLPELEIAGRAQQAFDQATVDRILRILYGRRPDFFMKIGASELFAQNPVVKKDVNRKKRLQEKFEQVRREFLDVAREIFVSEGVDPPPHGYKLNSIFWEMRRRSRVMYGLPITSEEMTDKHKQPFARWDAKWEPPMEMIILTMLALHNTPENLWEELKATEIRAGNLMNETGDKLREKIKEVNPDISVANGAKLTLRLRGIARKEAGIKDAISPLPKLKIKTGKKKVYIALGGMAGVGIIVAHPCGVIYYNQVGGFACLHPGEEGLFLPLATGDERAQNGCPLAGELFSYFFGPKWKGWCMQGIDEETADHLDSLFQKYRTTKFLRVDRSRLKDSVEAWVHVTLHFPEGYNLISGLNPETAILTWPNSD